MLRTARCFLTSWVWGLSFLAVVLGGTGVSRAAYPAIAHSYSNNLATITIAVTENVAPVANDVAVNGRANSSRNLYLANYVSDANDDPLTYILVDQPTHGTVTLNDMTLTYTPNNGFTGTDSFTYKANDGLADSNLATITITVTENAAPVANNAAVDVRANADRAIHLYWYVSDPNGDPLTYTLVDSPMHGTATLSTWGELVYTPSSGFTGADSFTYKANDDWFNSNIATITITVAGNTAPVANNAATSMRANSSKTLYLYSYVSDANDDPLTYTLVDQPVHGTVTLNYSTLTYTPNSGFTGTDSFTFKANDGLLESNIAALTITVVENAAPVANSATVKGWVNASKTIYLSGYVSDANEDPLTFSIVNQPANGTLTLSIWGEVVYTPNSGFMGTDSFTYKVNDGLADSNLATITITIAENVAPVANNASANMRANSSKTFYLYSCTSDANGDSLTYILVDPPTHGTVTLSTWGSAAYTPSSGFTGTDSFTYKVNDGLADSNIATITITVTENAAPVANNVSTNMRANNSKNISLYGCVSDPNGDSLTYTLVTQPTHGTVTLNYSTLTYTPSSGFTGTDSFTYKVNDGLVDSNVATVTLTIEENIAPVAQDATVRGRVNADKEMYLIYYVLDDNGDSLTYTIIDQPTHGTITLSESGSQWGYMVYTPSSGFIGTDSFTFKANDGLADSNLATVTLTIAENAAPVTSSFTLNLVKDQTRSIYLSASDADGDAISFTLLDQPTHGTLTLNGEEVTYVPNTGYLGTDVFTYKATDGTLESNTGTVTIRVVESPESLPQAWFAMDCNIDTGLTSVWGSSATDVYAVGSGGTILHYDGTIWSAVNSGSNSDLNGIWGSGAHDIFAVGAGGAILHFNGETWSLKNVGSQYYLQSVWGTSPQNVYAVGYSYLSGVTGGAIFHYDGIGWQKVYETNYQLLDIWGTGPNNIYCVGGGSSASSSIILHYDATNGWTQMHQASDSIFYGIGGSRDGEIMVVGFRIDPEFESVRGLILGYDGTAWAANPGWDPQYAALRITNCGSGEYYAAGTDGVASPRNAVICHIKGSSCTATPLQSGMIYDIGVCGPYDLFAVGTDSTGGGIIYHQKLKLISGDANGDGMVDVGDLGILAANYGGAEKNWKQGDFNNDGRVDVGDLGILAANYGKNAVNANWAIDFAKVSSTINAADEDSTDSLLTSPCSSLGLPLIALLFLAMFGLIQMKWENHTNRV